MPQFISGEFGAFKKVDEMSRGIIRIAVSFQLGKHSCVAHEGLLRLYGEDRSWRKRKMTFLSLSLLLASCWSSVGALSLRESENPIRRIVTLLQDMQKEIEAEGEKEEKAFNKFMCYCACASFYR